MSYSRRVERGKRKENPRVELTAKSGHGRLAKPLALFSGQGFIRFQRDFMLFDLTLGHLRSFRGLIKQW
jgi:hypothetical protein